MNIRVITAVLTVFTTLLLSWNTAEADRLVTYYHNDILGSPVAATDEAGELLWRETYRPYGEKIEDRDGNNRIGYTGHVFDQETGLTYMRARYYDPVIGRFMSTDPVGYTEANPVMSFNRYAYVNNNPYKYNDPDGEFLNFAIKFVADVALGTTLNYLESGELKLGAAVTDAAIGVVNPAKTLQKARRIANLVKRSCCFVAGTQVLTESGYKNIEDVQPGEKLWAKNIESGKQDWKPVTRIFVEPDRGIYAVNLVGAEGFEQSIEATDDHPFYVAGTGWKTTLELLAGDQIETDGYGAMAVASVVDQQRLDLTYNFAVADFHTYYVTERNILVHNCGGNVAKSVDPKTLIGRQGRNEMSSNKVKRLRRDMRENGFDSNNPIEAADVDGKLIILDGHHRTKGAIGAGIKEVPVNVNKVTREQADQLLREAAESRL